MMAPAVFARLMAYAPLLAWTVFFWLMFLDGTTQILVQTNQYNEFWIEFALLNLAVVALAYHALR